MSFPWSTALPEAQARVAPFVRRTPIEFCPVLSKETGAEVYLKLELLQETGSFKLRGAANKLLLLPPALRAAGVITASTGNHGAAVLHMARQLGIPVKVFLPANAAPAKIERLKKWGAELVLDGDDSLVSEQLARAESERLGLPFISPYNDEELIAGQATMTMEILEQAPGTEVLFVPVGGGGLISGAGAALHLQDSPIELVGCQPAASAVMAASVEAGRILDLPSLPTLSDGTAGGLEPGSVTFDLCRQWVNRWMLVEETEIRQAMLDIIRHHRYLPEGAAALGWAALRKAPAAFAGKKVVLVLCGRSLGLEALRDLMRD